MTLSDLPILAYELPRTEAHDDARIEATYQRDGSRLWVGRRMGWRLSTRGKWDHEPLPSSRTDAWIRRHTFQTPQAALAGWLRAQREGTP